MSSSKIIVNCGATQVAVAVFSGVASRPLLERFEVEDLDYDYGVENDWLGAVSHALSGIVKSLKLSGPASIIIPGYQLLTKTIKVPHVEQAKQAQMIAFEAQKQIPYPLNEVVWASQIISTDGIEAEVMLFALKHEVANRIGAIIRGAGLIPEVLEPSTILDYQAWRATNPGDTENALLVNIGARTTNLTFVGASGFSVHNVNIGGNMLTQSIVDTIAQPFRTSEGLKVSHFSGRTHFNEGDIHIAALKRESESFMRRLSQELTRRIVIHKRQYPDSPPKKIVLIGRGSLLPGLSEYLCESQRIGVDYLDPFPAFDVARTVDAEFLSGCRVRLAEIIGEAVRGRIPNSVGVNLIPAGIERDIRFAKIKPLLVATAALLAVAPWPIWNHYRQSQAETQRRLSAVGGELTSAQNFEAEINKTDESVKAAAGRVADLTKAAGAFDSWRDFLADFQERVLSVNDVWIEEMKWTRVSQTDPKKVEPLRLTVTFTLFNRKLAPDGVFDSAEYTAMRSRIQGKLVSSPFIAAVVTGGEKSDFSRPNLPRLTLVLDMRQEQKPL